MPYCSIHGFQQGIHCSQCGAPLSETPPAASDRIQVRSPEAHAHASANPTFVLPGGHVETRPALVKCPKCGKRSLEPATFDCQGDCGRQNLCERHFDEEYEVCVDCARMFRGEARAEAERQVKLQADLAAWVKRAEHAEAQVVELSRQGNETREAMEEAYGDLAAEQERTRSLALELNTSHEQARQTAVRIQALDAQVAQLQSERGQAQDRLRTLEKDLAQRRQDVEQARVRIAGLEHQVQETRAERDQVREQVKALQGEQAQACQRISILEPELVNWRKRAEKAEASVAAIERVQQEAEEARHRAEQASRQQIIRQQIGIELVCIPAGEFLYGENKRKVHLAEYWLAKTPVTNIQYKAFVDATGHRSSDYWKDGRIPSGKEMHPVVNVSWQDAVDFCQWGGLRLPTEQEWEKGARGTDGREYPWGSQAPDEKLCNFNMRVKDTTSVDQYPAGASAYGLLDMAGNVWEWCEDWSDSEHKYRVLRGGSWGDNANFVRVAGRYRFTPDNRYVSFGFRCARSP